MHIMIIMIDIPHGYMCVNSTATCMYIIHGYHGAGDFTCTGLAAFYTLYIYIYI